MLEGGRFAEKQNLFGFGNFGIAAQGGTTSQTERQGGGARAQQHVSSVHKFNLNQGLR
jgi:hypothetical protein